jgi:hypothetical protein
MPRVYLLRLGSALVVSHDERDRSRGASLAWVTLFVHLSVFVVSFWSTNMSAIAIPAAVIVVDVGTVDPRERHPMVFDTFEGLAPGQALANPVAWLASGSTGFP